MKNAFLVSRSALFSFLALGLTACGPGYRVVTSSGASPIANPLGVQFDYSHAQYRDGLNEAAWTAQRNPEELASYRLVRETLHREFIDKLAERTGLQVVPATGNEPVVLVVAVQEFEMGRWASFASIATRLAANMRFMRGNQITDEISVRIEVNPVIGSSREGRMGDCGRQQAERAAEFIATTRPR